MVINETKWQRRAIQPGILVEIETTMLTGPTNMDLSTRRTSRFAFTLVELLVTIVILSILSSLVLFAMTGALETAKIQQTKTRIAKLDREISRMWNGYLSRRIPIRFKRPPGVEDDWQNKSYRMARQQGRLVALRDLMRLEMPDRKADVTGDVYPGAVDFNGDDTIDERDRPLVSKAYLNLASKTQWTAKFQGAECLYMILTVNAGTGSRGRPFLSENEVGDVDGDGMPEILDAWDEPIRFLRWAPGFDSPLYDRGQPDPFDPHQVDNMWNADSSSGARFPLYPVLLSTGPNREFALITLFPGFNPYRKQIAHGLLEWYVDPYHKDGVLQIGSVPASDPDHPDPAYSASDDIHNHLVETN